MYTSDKSIPHLLWRILIALRTTEENTPFPSEIARRVFLTDWMMLAQRKNEYRGMESELSTLQQLIEKTDITISVEETLNSLLEHACAAEQCDLFRFRSALNTLLQLGWLHTVCRFPENISTELMDRRKGDCRHLLQLTRTESAFHPVGHMVKPVTFQLLFSQKDAERQDAEETFFSDGFQIVYANRELNLTNNRILRTLHIGLPSLPHNEWNPLDCDIWTARGDSGGKTYH